MLHWNHVLNPELTKGKGSWRPDEDRRIVEVRFVVAADGSAFFFWYTQELRLCSVSSQIYEVGN